MCDHQISSFANPRYKVQSVEHQIQGACVWIPFWSINFPSILLHLMPIHGPDRLIPARGKQARTWDIYYERWRNDLRGEGMRHSNRFLCLHQIAQLVENLIQKAWVQILTGSSIFLPSNYTCTGIKLIHLQRH